MKFQPSRGCVSNDDIETPDWLAAALVAYFQPTGRILEPCCGSGRFLRALPPETEWCEIKQGRDFLALDSVDGRFDWIVTNPPWSQIRAFLRRSLGIADNIVFLMTINHAWTKARLRDLAEAGFSLRTLVLVPTPKEFPQSGFQLGAVHYARGECPQIRVHRLHEQSLLEASPRVDPVQPGTSVR
jgi:hypothetical protein